MSLQWVEIVRKCLLGITLVLSVWAFLPDTTHLSATDEDHESVEISHDDNPANPVQHTEKSGSSHCHTAVSCTGAINIRNQMVPTTTTLLLNATFFQRGVTDTSLELWRDPPVPIALA